MSSFLNLVLRMKSLSGLGPVHIRAPGSLLRLQSDLKRVSDVPPSDAHPYLPTMRLPTMSLGTPDSALYFLGALRRTGWFVRRSSSPSRSLAFCCRSFAGVRFLRLGRYPVSIFQ